jgi:adenylate cyclase
MLMAVAMAVVALVVGGIVATAVHRRRLGDALERRLRASADDLEAMQQAFQRFAPAEVVEAILAQGVGTVASRSERKEVTILFADLRSFTRMSERLDPAELVEILNGYFEKMSRAITGRRGHVSKFIGDGILALFGALEPNPWQTNDAAHAALDMVAGLREYNAELRASGRPELSVGIGIHRGTVVAGVIGSQDLMEYTVIGAEVNLASRVESLTRTHGVDVLVTDAVKDVLDPRFRLRAMPLAEVKGVSEPVATHALEGRLETD